MKNIIKLNKNDKIVSFGRTGINEAGMALFWTGSAIEFNICASELCVSIECWYAERELMIDIILDGERSQKLILKNGLDKYTVFRGMNPEKPVNVRIVRDTQCMPDDSTSYILLSELETDGKLTTAPKYDFNIEFIGDSLTSGEGCGLIKRDEWAPVVFDALDSYTYQVARTLDARYSVLSQSGWGLYASWDGNFKNVLPDYYELVCGTSGCKRAISLGAHDTYDFTSTEMDVVLINLGTNDWNALNTDRFDNDKFLKDFKEKGIEFLKKVRKLNSTCLIIWAYGMLGHEMEPYIKEIIREYVIETGDKRAEYLRLPKCTPAELGARFHPTPEAHYKTAGIIADHIRSVQAYMLR